MNHETISDFRKELTALVGVPCSLVTDIEGSEITLLFGETYSGPIAQPSSGEVRLAGGGRRLALRWAAWRLRLEAKMLCSSSSPSGPGSEMEIGLRNLLRQTVIAVELEPVMLDLRLVFGNDMRFEIFSDQVEDPEGYGTYALRCPRGWFTVGANSRVRFTPAKASQGDQT